jgi:hypothetical protein
MAKIITRPSIRETTLGVSFAVAELRSITVGTSIATIREFPEYGVAVGASVANNAETIQLSFVPTAAQTAATPPVTGFYLDAGTVLSFSATKVTIAKGIQLTTSPQSVETLPIVGTIASAAATKTSGAVFVVGCSKSDVAPEIKTSDATNYLSGIGAEMVVTGNSKKLSIETQCIYGDRGTDLLRRFAYDTTYVGREFYFEVLYPSGESHKGIALVTSATPENTAQELRKLTCEAQVQGQAYEFLPATVTGA